MAKAKQKDGFWETLKTIFWALVIAAAFRTILFQPFSIPSGSMKPNLLVGDYLFVSKFAYGYSRYSLPFSPDVGEGRIWASLPERGDVVVFKHPQRDQCSQGPIELVVSLARRVAGARVPYTNDCTDYVKRVVGLPGDQIQVSGGVLSINGIPVGMERVADFVEIKQMRGNPPSAPRCLQPEPSIGGECAKEQWLETLPEGTSHRVLNLSGTIGQPGTGPRGTDDTSVFTVPDGHLFFMGDNRDNSVDSRKQNDVGMVPLENLIGRADVVAFSWDGPIWKVWDWRADRFFKWIE
ncbi:MAG: signal peptidase I [Pseudomonadota bacterium]